MDLHFKTKAVLFLGLVFCLLNCSKNKADPQPQTPTELGKAKVWITKGDQSKLLSREADLSIQALGTALYPVINVDTVTRYQTVDGFGAALTGSSAYLLNHKLSSGARQTLLRKLFDTVNGIGISYLRLTMGASDFSLQDFTYDDLAAGQEDQSLLHFSLANDTVDVIPMLQEILQITPDLSLMGTPWSPPAWMKTNNNLKGGKLKTGCYAVYADYFARYIQYMKTRGITISSITPQNEPLFYTANYPCMEMQATEQLEFIKSHLGPRFQAKGIATKIITYDHNWDQPGYAISILNDATAKSFVEGSAFHAYAGDVSAMSTVHNAHPDKGLYFTEISGGAWATDFGGNLLWNMKNIFIGTMQNWSKCALLWNLALDQNYGPTNNGCSNCRGVVTINSANSQITYNEEYYSIAHFSKFVRPGAVRVATTMPASLNEVGAVAFLNPDGSKAIIICNYNTTERNFSITQGAKIFHYTLAPRAVTTITW